LLKTISALPSNCNAKRAKVKTKKEKKFGAKSDSENIGKLGTNSGSSPNLPKLPGILGDSRISWGSGIG
jgi:hypothetical protein